MTFTCKTAGIHPRGIVGQDGHTCPFFNTGACTLDESQKCSSRSVVVSTEECSNLTHIDIPEPINQIKRMLAGPDIYELFSDKLYESVVRALEIMDQVNPMYFEGTNGKKNRDAAWRYWNNGEQIEFDMGQLSSLHAYLSAMHAKLVGSLKSAQRQFKIFRAKKFSVIKKQWRTIGQGRESDRAIEHAADMDPEVIDAMEPVSNAEEAEKVFEALLSSTLEHIQVLKKRIATLSSERQAIR